jgi:hypothetical protein
MSDLLALAERCEAAMGPDRELDVAIGLTGKFYIAEPRYPGAEPMIGYIDEDGSRVEPGNGSQDRLVPRYTASLDAAMTLVPKRHNFSLDRIGGECGAVVNYTPFTKSASVSNRCATPALALTAACLKARAASTPSLNAEIAGMNQGDSV